MSERSNSAQSLFLIRMIVLSAIVLGIVASMTGARAGQEKNGLRIALVDPAKLLQEYKFAKSSQDILEKLDGEAKVAIFTWNRFPFLSPQDQDSLSKLILKERTPGQQLTKVEADQEKALGAKHDALLKEYQDLAAKPIANVTPQDTARLEAFNKLKNDTEVRIKSKQTDAQKEIDAKSAEFNQKINKDVHDTIAKVAKEKGINLVFSSQVVYFADTDLTEDVLKVLNK